MKITSTAIIDGRIEDAYGKRGSQFNVNGVPTYSLPFKIEEAPVGTKSFAIAFIDNDAIPVSGGFAWIHWTACNITKNEVLANESITATDFIQGLNSWTSMQGGEQSQELSRYFGGCCPPDAPHMYELRVYALDTILNIENGYWLNEMYRKIRGHVLEEGVLYGEYSN